MYGCTDVQTDGHVTITSQPKFLGLIGYHISLAMELRWRALPAGSAINSMGGTHSMECHSVAKTICLFCMERKIWLSAARIPGKDNITADREFRIFSDNKEWMLSTHLFQEIVATWGEPTIDLFASRLNKQVACYASWKPDPEASYVDAFSIICFLLFPHLV